MAPWYAVPTVVINAMGVGAVTPSIRAATAPPARRSKRLVMLALLGALSACGPLSMDM
jgi:hypothetical protein